MVGIELELGLPEARRPFRVTLALPLREEAGGPVPWEVRVPSGLADACSEWTGPRAVIGGTVLAKGLPEAVVLGVAALGDLLEIPGAELAVSPAGTVLVLPEAAGAEWRVRPVVT